MEEARARELLRVERERLERSIAAIERPDADEGNDGDPHIEQHIADQGSDLYDKEFAEGQLGELRDQLAAVERAEKRLAEGSFGRDFGQPRAQHRSGLVRGWPGNGSTVAVHRGSTARRRAGRAGQHVSLSTRRCVADVVASDACNQARKSGQRESDPACPVFLHLDRAGASPARGDAQAACPPWPERGCTQGRFAGPGG